MQAEMPAPSRSGEPGRRWWERVPLPLARFLAYADVALAMAFPPWGGWLEYRATGRWPRRLGLLLTLQAHRYGRARASPRRHGWMLTNLCLGKPLVVHCDVPERTGWASPGSCAACTTRGCCHRPDSAGHPVACPFLDLAGPGTGCGVYAGAFWQVGPCGRYPESQQEVEEYHCPRFQLIGVP
jgi:hypothetical protein